MEFHIKNLESIKESSSSNLRQRRFSGKNLVMKKLEALKIAAFGSNSKHRRNQKQQQPATCSDFLEKEEFDKVKSLVDQKQKEMGRGRAFGEILENHRGVMQGIPANDHSKPSLPSPTDDLFSASWLQRAVWRQPTPLNLTTVERGIDVIRMPPSPPVVSPPASINVAHLMVPKKDLYSPNSGNDPASLFGFEQISGVSSTPIVKSIPYPVISTASSSVQYKDLTNLVSKNKSLKSSSQKNNKKGKRRVSKTIRKYESIAKTSTLVVTSSGNQASMGFKMYKTWHSSIIATAAVSKLGLRDQEKTYESISSAAILSNGQPNIYQVLSLRPLKNKCSIFPKCSKCKKDIQYMAFNDNLTHSSKKNEPKNFLCKRCFKSKNLRKKKLWKKSLKIVKNIF